jgi:hypothetical protein
MQAAIGPLAIRSEFFSKWAWDICVWASRPPNYRVGKPNTSSSQRSCSAISAEIRCMFSITNHGAASIRRSAIGDLNSTVGLGDTVIVVEHDLDVITASCDRYGTWSGRGRQQCSRFGYTCRSVEFRAEPDRFLSETSPWIGVKMKPKATSMKRVRKIQRTSQTASCRCWCSSGSSQARVPQRQLEWDRSAWGAAARFYAEGWRDAGAAGRGVGPRGVGASVVQTIGAYPRSQAH